MINCFVEILPYLTGTATGIYGILFEDPVFVITVASNFIVFLLTGFLKRIIKQERPNNRSLHGMPSGHCSYFFSLTTMMYYFEHYKMFFACFILSNIIAYQRIVSRNHTHRQVIAGIFFGYGVTFFIYKFFIVYLINVRL